jgi:hypothetical protein
MFETGYGCAAQANNLFDKVVQLAQEIEQIESIDGGALPEWAAEALSQSVATQRKSLASGCRMFRYFNDQAEYFLSEPADQEWRLGNSGLMEYMNEKQQSINDGTRGYGSATLDALAKKYDAEN